MIALLCILAVLAAYLLGGPAAMLIVVLFSIAIIAVTGG